MTGAAPSPSHRSSGSRRWLNRTVLGAGVTSALGDLAYETTTVVLPGFLAVLGLPAAALGAIEGISDTIASFTKLASGHIANRLGHRKALVVLGYAMTPLGQALIASAAGWPLILAGRSAAWFGKGLRGPLRDTIIAESVTAETRGRAFGFHRAMDTIGAILGPLLGVALLSVAQGWHLADGASAFRLVIWLTLIPGVLSCLAFAVLVKDDRRAPHRLGTFWRSLAAMPPRFRRYLAAVGLFAIGDFSHSLLILGATQMLTPDMGLVRAAQVAGLLYVMRNAIQAIASYPIGALADRVGVARVLAIGYALGAVTAGAMALALAAPSGRAALLPVVFAVAAMHMAAQEALEATRTAELVAPESRSVAFGTLGAVNGFGKLASSTSIGLIWTAVSPTAAFAIAGAMMGAGTIAMIAVSRPSRGQ